MPNRGSEQQSTIQDHGIANDIHSLANTFGLESQGQSSGLL